MSKLTKWLPLLPGVILIIWLLSKVSIPANIIDLNNGSPGPGVTQLKTYLTEWRYYRDIFYLTFAILFVLKGFTILNKNKFLNNYLNLGSLCVGLILLTFSYALAGIMIDVVYIIKSFNIVN